LSRTRSELTKIAFRQAPLLLLLAVTISACAAPQSQAGQASPPFRLDVVFRPHTTVAAAETVLARCRHEPGVIRIARPSTAQGRLTATVYTKTFGRTEHTEPLLTRLHDARAGQDAAWPD
jgi:hypothetical protein